MQNGVGIMEESYYAYKNRNSRSSNCAFPLQNGGNDGRKLKDGLRMMMVVVVETWMDYIGVRVVGVHGSECGRSTCEGG